MECKIVTPYFSKTVNVKEISIDSTNGVLLIYPQHTDMISSIKKDSLLNIKSTEGSLKYKCNQGVIKIQSNKALILIDTDEKDNM
ncbi:MAG: hypothetical protein RMJ36_01550 [Candidatus Calescibacterium sp.]|nr:hypothetical protein [Candidatus Calescibacterium sp.]MDW8132325.1 hypothetical protein [Candidatus Calescibacterium sp.]